MVLGCQACHEDFSGRNPMNLKCGHVICSSCVPQGLSVTCPECRAVTNDTSTLSVNYPLARVLEYGSIIKPPHESFCGAAALPSWGETYPCRRHNNPVVQFCNSCQTWICQDCLVVDHPPLPRGSCRILEAGPAMESIRKAYSEGVHKLLEDSDSFCQNKLYLHIDIVEFIKNHLDKMYPMVEFFTRRAMDNYYTFSLVCENTIDDFIIAPKETPCDINNLIIKTLDFTEWMKDHMHILDVAAKPLRALISYSFRRVSFFLYFEKKLYFK